MASELKARITGKCVHTEKQSFGAGERAFKFTDVHIQTSVSTITAVRFTDRWEFDMPRPGDLMDVEVSLSGFSGRNGLDLSATATRPFDESYMISQHVLTSA